MTYTIEERRAYYLRRREYHINYSKEYVKKHRDKYLAYYREYNSMKTELAKKLKYKEADKTEPQAKSEPKPKPEPKPKKVVKPKGVCEICNDKYKGSFKQHLMTTKHLINEQINHSKNLKIIKNNLMTSNNIKYFEMFSIEDLKEALVLLGHEEVEDMCKEELYAYIITLINADDIEDDSSEDDEEEQEEVDYHGIVFKCSYSE